LIFLSIFFKKIQKMAHNVPAVYDVFASPIKETAGFQGLQKCGWSEPWERSDLGERNPGATEGSGAYTDLLCAVAFAFSLPISIYFI
jgi:hypothetical protein